MRVFIDFGAESAALGTHAMFVATISLLQKSLPEAQFIILSLYPEADRRRYGDLGFNLSIVRKRPGRVSTAWALMRQYSRADLIVGVYGDGFVMASNVQYLEFVVKMLLASLSRKPVVILPASIGPFPKGIRSILARWATRRVSAIAAREETTYRHLVEIGVPRSRLYLKPDMAFACPAAPPGKLTATMAARGLSQPKRPLVGICVCQPLSFYSRQHLSGGEEYTQIMAATSDHVVQNLDGSVVLVPYYLWPPSVNGRRADRLRVGGGNDDITAIREVYDMIQCKDRVVAIDDYHLDVTELNGIIGHCDLLVGARLHASIAGLSSAVPTIAIDFRYKTPAVMGMVGLGEYYCDLRTLTSSEIAGKIDDLWNNRDGVRAMLKARGEEFRSAIHSFIESTCGVMAK